MFPSPDRPQMPSGYGMLTGGEHLPWSWAEERLVSSRNYWIATTRPDGRPHVMPVWGVWLEGSVIFGTDRGSRKARNLAASPAVVVHLESGDEVVIIEGPAEEIADTRMLQAADDAYKAKYGQSLLGAPGDVIIYRVRPVVVFAWQESDFFQATRWRFFAL